MTPLKTWYLLHLGVLLIAPTATEVVQSMTQCGFLLGKAPQVPGVLENGVILKKNQYKVICQTYNSVRRFVTLYDTKNRIPVLSAYKFTGGGPGDRPRVNWMMEPQLEDMKNGKNMEDCNITTVYTNQAGETDYNSVREYNKGHLIPSSYGNGEDDKTSTFTLTNAVPQVTSFNTGRWARMETCFKSVMKNCINHYGKIEAYVMTGAKPSVNNTIRNNSRVNIPSVLWSAFCCYSSKLGWIASAYWGDNVPENKTIPLKLRTLKELLDKQHIKAFPELRCPQNKIHLSINEDCKKIKG